MLTIIIPTLNHYSFTEECINSIYEKTTDFTIIVINDGSTDETNTKLHELIKTQSIIIHNVPQNLGFAKAVNQGIKLAETELIAIFNNDMVAGHKWFENILKGITECGWGMSSGKCIEPQMCPREQFEEFATINAEMPSTFLKFAKEGPWLFKKEVFDEVGLFDEQFEYGQYEDIDMLMRMAHAGFEFGVVENSYVYHYGSITQHGELLKRISNKYIQKNRSKFEEKWGTIHFPLEQLEQIVKQGKENK